MPNPAASPAVSSTVGLKNMVIAPLTVDTEETLTYGELQLVAGAIEASITPQNADPDVQYFDDQEGDVLYQGVNSMNSNMSGDFPTLAPGANAVSWTGNVTKVVIQPNWRYLA